MKKVFTVLTAVVFAAVLFMSNNSTLKSDGLDLANLVSLNSANAECVYKGFTTNYFCEYDECIFKLSGAVICDPN